MPQKLILASLVSILGTLLCLPVLWGAEKEKEEPHALLVGSVFSEEGFSLPGVPVSVKRRDDRKPKWRAISDRRGEFAVRLPTGRGTYEVTTHSRNHENQTKRVEVQDRERVHVLFRLSRKEEKRRQS